MAFQRLPESVQTLYAELFELTVHAAAEATAQGALPGTFVSKSIKGGTYWYLQRMEGGRKRQHYLGRESPALLAWMEEARRRRDRSAADGTQRTKLASMLAAGGATTESASILKVLSLLAESGVFRVGGVLCRLNKELRIERTSEGDLVTMTPAGTGSSSLGASLVTAPRSSSFAIPRSTASIR